MADHLQQGSVFDQIEDDVRLRAATQPLLDEARQDRETIKALVAALKNARRSMIVSVTGIADGLTIHDIRRWIEEADAALAKAER